MEVKCTLCGKKIEISKIHKDYQRLARDPNSKYICWNCENRVKVHASEKYKPRKPM